jgi:hypothetical protein
MIQDDTSIISHGTGSPLVSIQLACARPSGFANESQHQHISTYRVLQVDSKSFNANKPPEDKSSLEVSYRFRSILRLLNFDEAGLSAHLLCPGMS